ncbi:MAG: hypothetical protein H8D22_00440, partial [Candidatus Cloacimonetes bacterium]|nr:hypothetical protein [Candidatus Cloacimonadota bacterium]
MKFKFIIISLFLLISAQTVCADLTVFFDCNRFLTENNNTIFEITYKIFHKDLQFEYFEDKLSAQIGVQCFIFDKQGKKLYNKFYSPMISASPGKTTIESEGFFIDKIIAEVTPGTYQFDIEIMDRLSGKKIVWNKILETLDTDELSISDLEINSFFKSDTTKSFTNFKRDNFIFLVNPNHLINPEESLGFAYYFEVYFP